MNAWRFLFVGVSIVGALAYLPPVWAEDAAVPQFSGRQAPAGRAFDDAQAVLPGDSALAKPEVKRQNGPKTSTDKIVDKFMSLDVDGSSSVSMDEYITMVQQYITMVQQRVLARFAAMDADRDGEVTEDEYRAFWKSRMAKWYRLKR